MTERAAIFMVGNITEGYRAFGPYPDLDAAMNAHEGDEGWGMTLEPGNNNEEVSA